MLAVMMHDSVSGGGGVWTSMGAVGTMTGDRGDVGIVTSGIEATRGGRMTGVMHHMWAVMDEACGLVVGMLGGSLDMWAMVGSTVAVTDGAGAAITHHNGKHSTFQSAHNLLP